MEDQDSEQFLSPQIGVSRRIARDLLSKSNSNTYPIKIISVARFVSDLYIDGVEMEDEISGLQASYNGNFFIRYNSSHPIKRNRFTVAHELGHVLLGHTTPCSRQLDGLTTNIEIEANEFAAELLMPLALLKEAIKIHTSIKDLARAFWVSEEAMSKRIMKTSLFKKLKSW